MHKRVERYEMAFDELQEAHEDVKEILAERLLHERWRQLGAELGFEAAPLPASNEQSKRDLAALKELNHVNEMNESWAG